MPPLPDMTPTILRSGPAQTMLYLFYFQSTDAVSYFFIILSFVFILLGADVSAKGNEIN